MSILHEFFDIYAALVDQHDRCRKRVDQESPRTAMRCSYLSRAIIRKKADYYRLLLDVTVHGAWEAWILYMLVAIEETARWTTERMRAIQQLMQATAEHVRLHADGAYSRELVELIFVQPYCRIKNVVDAGIAQRQTAAVYLRQLRDAGVLREVKVGREKLFINPRLMRLLTTERPGDLSFARGA